MGDFEDGYRKWHTRFSFAKSAIRIGASGLALIAITAFGTNAATWALAIGYGIAEVLGIIEEMI